MIKFAILDKSNCIDIIPKLYDILFENMSRIAPTNNSYDEDYNIWSSNVIPALSKEQRQIILISENDDMIGYFQYYTNNDILMMEEIQIKTEWQQKGLFHMLFGYIIDNISENIDIVEAYANKKNVKSQGILKHLGLSIVKENKNNYQYRGKYRDLIDWYYNKD